ncbi:MAG: hypothetical protein ACKVRN_01765 [Pyrinomonadaceae bacterium]
MTTFLLVIGFVFACTETPSGGATPTEAYKMLYAAVKSKNTEAIKKLLTKKTVEFGAMASQRNNTPIEKVYENGFSATTFSETLPTMRDERVNGDMGALEVWNSKDSKWEDLGFIKEDGAWKLAVGDVFAGTYKSPGPGLDLREKEAANAVANSNILISNSNLPISMTNAAPAANAKRK